MRLLLAGMLLASCRPGPFDSGLFDSVGPGDSGDSGVEDTGPPDDERGFGLLSLNLHCLLTSGTGFADNRARFAAVAEVVAAERVRVIALQELCVSADESAPELLEQALEQATGSAWTLAASFAHTGWEGTADEADEYVGLAVQGGFIQSRELVFHVQDGLRRVGVEGLWDAGFAQLSISSVHLDHQHDQARLGQARQAAVEALVGPAGAASLVLGDFNDTPGSDPFVAMQAMGFDDWGAGLDDDRIDYVWAHRGVPLTVARFERIFTGAPWPEVSDHAGMLAVVEPADPQPVVMTTVSTEHAAHGRYLALRGDTAPLSWEQGWPASRDGDGWTAAFSELGSDFEYKWLLDDVDWQAGDNRQGQAGQANQGEVDF